MKKGLIYVVGLSPLLYLGSVLHVWLTHLSPDEVKMILTSPGFFTMLASFIAASAAIYVSYSRSREAINADFRDQMQWAMERVEKENSEQVFALLLIERYAQNPSRLLSIEDRQIAQEVQEFSQTLTSQSIDESNTVDLEDTTGEDNHGNLA